MSTTTRIFQSERQKLHERLKDHLEIANHLNRKVVSFQANKEEPFYRWFKYKEGFSSSLVKYLLTNYSTKPGRVLDPFAGAGTTLFAARELGWEGWGIELLPVGTFAMQAREAVDNVNHEMLRSAIASLWNNLESVKPTRQFSHIAITRDAFPDETEEWLNRYLTYCETFDDVSVKRILRFAAFTVLEDISYTRKDGQYLRWDYRSKRKLKGKEFDKGRILLFKEAIDGKLRQILSDLTPSTSQSLFDDETPKPQRQEIHIIEGSCLHELPMLEDDFFDFVLTSPPYCNRYDYTRTYALELVFLGADNDRVRELRQAMLSCTVENKEKVDSIQKFYESIGALDRFDRVLAAYKYCAAMNEVNEVLDTLNKSERLNNSNVPRMVRNYFLEMCFVIHELARVTLSGGRCVMVNDNVRYGGEDIPVDLILSEFAEQFGLTVERIFVLPGGKGNSSQQMGNYGRTPVRKCVYLWRKD